jgi:phosphoribosylformimino-5-aminoimidazole carboxamide ribotide isomerase
MALTPIPAIDLKDGRCVRLYQGRFDQVSEYAAAPEELAARYLSLGVDWVHVVDLDGARDGAGGNRKVIARMAGLARGRIQVGGGIRSRADVEAMLALGVGRVVIGSAAAERPGEVQGWFDVVRPGAPRARLRRDARRCGHAMVQDPRLDRGRGAVAVGRDRDLPGRRPAPRAVHRRGARRRHDRAQLRALRGMHAPLPGHRAAGLRGIRDLADLEALRGTGAAGAIIGKALLDGRITDEEIRSFLRNA